MKKRLSMVAVLALLSLAAVAQTPGRVEQTFKSGGRVEMQLSAGDYQVRAGASDKIVLNYRTEREEQMRSVEAKIKVVGAIARIETDGPHSNFHVVIEVPPQTNLYIRLSAGDLNVKGITGNKDIESHAGDLNIYIGNPDDYGAVDASVGAGDLNASAFGKSTGGLFRKFKHTGKGKYTLHAHLGAGDLNLR